MSIRPFPHQRPVVCAALAYGAGIWAGVRFDYAPLLFAVGLGLSLAATVLLYCIGRKGITGLMAAFLFLGMLFSGAASHPLLPEPGKYLVEGIVAEDVKLREDGKAVGYLERVTLSGEGEEHFISRVYWTYYYDEETPFLPLDGQRVHFQGNLYHPTGQTNPFGFDFRMFLLQKGAAAGISGMKDPVVTAVPGRGLASFFYRINQSLSRKVQEIFGESSALPDALLLGNRERLPQEVQDSYSSAGVAHVLSVSGLHVALLAAVLQMFLQKWLGPKGRLGVLAAFLALYCGLLNFSAPVVRASLLLLFGGIQKTVRRAPDHLTTLSAAFILILLFRPLDLFSASFQLSFGAVLGIVMLKPVLERLLRWIPWRFLRENIGLTLAASAGIALPTIQVFHRISLIGLAINPLVCMLFGLLLPAYGAVLALGCLAPDWGQAAAVVMNKAAEGINCGIHWLGNLPFATLRLPSLPWYVLGACVLILLFSTAYVVLSRGKKLLIGAAALIIGLGAWHISVCRDVQYLQLDMGQADAAIILDGDETVLIDTGEYGGDVVSYLLSTGRRADYIFLSHLHTDHIGGMDEILAADIPVGKVILPVGAFDQDVGEEAFLLRQALAEKDIPISFWGAGDAMETRRASFSCVWPVADAVRSGHDPNRYSMALLCDLAGVRVYAAGEIEGTFEHYAAVEADILKVSHHGSKNSTGEHFLSLVSPSAALITANRGSTTMPHPDTLSRLAKAGVFVYHTGEQGALHIRVQDGRAVLTPYLSRGEEP